MRRTLNRRIVPLLQGKNRDNFQFQQSRAESERYKDARTSNHDAPAPVDICPTARTTRGAKGMTEPQYTTLELCRTSIRSGRVDKEWCLLRWLAGS